MKLLDMIEGERPADPEEIVWAYRVLERARELAPHAREVYGGEHNLSLDGEALMAALIEAIREIRKGIRVVA